MWPHCFRRPAFFQQIALLLGTSLLLAGCSPAFDWRVVRHPDGLWQATFPEKPVVVSRTVQLIVDGRPKPIGLELRAGRVGQQTFTVGIAKSEDAQLSKEAVRAALEEAMIHNIQGQVIRREARAMATLREPVTANLVEARGSIRLSPQAPTEPARLIMTSVVLGQVVVEALVAGPEEGFSQEAAEQFLESFSLKDSS